jgi:xylan 1,4-beta-xylosidase
MINNSKANYIKNKMRLIEIIKMKRCVLLMVLSILIKQVYGQQPAYKIVIDVKKKAGSLKPIWTYFGYDEPNYTYMKDGRKLLTELAQMSKVPVYIRVHNLLTTGDGTPALKWGSTNAYTEDAKGNAIYNWHIVDSIFDTFIERGMKPIAEIGFMPKALSIKPEPYRHHWTPQIAYDSIYTGWAYPPESYEKWAELVHQWVKHCIIRYGESEVKTWYWEVWNEPNIGYWKGTREEYFKLYDYSVDAVKRALPSARVGGPTTTGPRWDVAADFLKSFLEHCRNGKNYATGKKGAPLDYVTFHAKGDPKIVNEHVQMNMAVQLQDIEKGFEIVASFPGYKKLPIIIGESDPEGCAACSVDFNPQNAYRNGTMYSSYTAASFACIFILAEKYGVNIEGTVSWSFEFENQKWFAGFRDLATNGVDKPVLNVFRMFNLMEGNMIKTTNKDAINLDSLVTTGVRSRQTNVDVLASADEHSLSAMIWNYHDDDVEDSLKTAHVNLLVKNIPAEKGLLYHYRVDKQFSNSYQVWKRMGSPQNVSQQQYRQLEQAGQLQLFTSPVWTKVENEEMAISFSLPLQAVSLIKIVW